LLGSWLSEIYLCVFYVVSKHLSAVECTATQSPSFFFHVAVYCYISDLQGHRQKILTIEAAHGVSFLMFVERSYISFLNRDGKM